jgi:hypothetical protein
VTPCEKRKKKNEEFNLCVFAQAIPQGIALLRGEYSSSIFNIRASGKGGGNMKGT